MFPLLETQRLLLLTFIISDVMVITTMTSLLCGAVLFDRNTNVTVKQFLGGKYTDKLFKYLQGKDF